MLYSGVSSTIELNWLYAETAYMFSGYLETLQASVEPESSVVSFTTPPMPSVYKLKLEVQNNIAQSQEELIRNTVASHLGVNPLWLADPKFTRSLSEESTFFEWNVLFDRRLTTFTPRDVVTQPANLALAKTDLVLKGYADSTSTVFFDYSVITADTPAQFSADPTFSSATSTTATFSVTTTIRGLACVACAREHNEATSPQQVQAGLTAASAQADGADCAATEESVATDLIAEGLTPGTEYFCYFTVCSEYPLWPTCREGSSSGLFMLELRTEDSELNDELSCAAAVAVVGLWALFA